MSPSGNEAIEQLDPTTDDEVTAADLLTLYTELGRRITACTTSGAAFTALTAAALDTVPGVDHASVTRRRDGRFQTLAPTDAVATAADSLQYELDDGPCVDAVRDGGPLNGDDLAHDARWPEYGPRVAAKLGVASMVSLSMVVDADVEASLNLYSDQVRGLTARSKTLAVILATYGTLYVGWVAARERAVNLETALINSRRIGMAVGVLMTARKVRDSDAFDLMRAASQNTNRRMVLVAEEIIETGTIEPVADAVTDRSPRSSS